MSDVTITAYNEATEPHRIERLGRVWKALRRKRRVRLTESVMSEPTPAIETAVRALHDHKGVLFVDWGGAADDARNVNGQPRMAS
jgi:hypothetical protein